VLSVLLIDDEPAILEVIKIMSERSREMSVETAQSAKEGLKILQDKSFDAIIVDYDMPEITGIAFLKIIRSKGDTTPVIIYTAVGREHAAIEALNNGANFFLKKGEDPRVQFRELVTMAKRAVEQNSLGRSVGTTQRIISDLINFSSDPGFAIDRDGKVVAWNDSMEQLTDVPASIIIGKGDFAYAEPLFGAHKKMLVDLVFEPDSEIKRQNYMIISRVPKGPVIAVARGKKTDGTEWTLWSKAMPIYDNQGNFIAVVGTVRDVTATFGDIVIKDPTFEDAEEISEAALSETPKPAKGLFDKLLGKSSSYYKQGVILYGKEKKYTEAIELFDQALKIDEKLPHVWNDRGLCFSALGDHKSALKSQLRAVELAPENPEFLFDLGETLEKIGVLHMNNKYLDSAIQTFKMVVSQMPNNANAWNHIGICMKEMGRGEESKFYFTRARDIHLWKKDTPIIRRRDDVL
jgi:DNA-binding response OmpR family regulator